MYQDRVKLYNELEEKRNSKLLVYITGDRPGLETQIHPEVFDYFVNHLDALKNPVSKISLYLYTRGGNTLASWSLVNLIRQFCKEFEVIVPSKSLSAGTLICLGANSILMTKQATLGPIDPSVNTPLNPQVPGAPVQARVPVSVEAIKGYIELAKDELKIKDDHNVINILLKLSDFVHPLVLGQVYRTRTQIRMLAKKLLSQQITDVDKTNKIISFLVSESGSHDYTINRKEAKETLGLNIEKPDDDLYIIIKKIYDDIQKELELNVAYDPPSLLGNNSQHDYTFKRGLIESIAGGSDACISRGTLYKRTIPTPQGNQTGIEDQRRFEGWKHDSV